MPCLAPPRGDRRRTESDNLAVYEEERSMEFLIFLAVIAAVGGGVLWGRKNFRSEIERAKRIRRANKNN